MKVLHLLVADYANISREGKLNVMGIFNQVGGSNFPLRHPEMHVIVKLEASPAESGSTRKLSILLLDYDAKNKLVDWKRDITVPEGHSGERIEINQILRLRDIVFPSTGIYQFSVLVDDDEKGATTISVVKGEPSKS